MKNTYSITEAQAKFPSIVKEAADSTVVITRRDAVVGYLISPERMEGIMETLELLADPEAMLAVESAESNRTRYRSLDALDASDAG